MARVVDVLDYLFDRPLTSDAEGVLEGRQCAPVDALGRPYHPLESPAVAGGAVSVKGGAATMLCCYHVVDKLCCYHAVLSCVAAMPCYCLRSLFM